MEIKLQEADNLSAFLLEAIKLTKGIIGYKLSRNLRILNDELVEYKKIKTEMFEKYGHQDGDVFIIDKESDNFVKYCEEMKQYENETINVNFKKLTEQEIESCELTGEQLYLLYDYMIEEDK